jgi:hypothetical protein
VKAKISRILEVHPLVLAVLIFFALAIPYSALNQPSGHVGEAVGIIETLSVTGKGHIITSVRLKDGALVQATLATKITPTIGQTAHMRTYHRVISKEKTYEIDRTYSTN